MIEHALDSNNDMVIKNGSFTTVKDGAQVVQHIRTRLQFYLEEWFLDNKSGTPWIQEIFVKPVDLRSVESILKLRISNTPELKEITEFSMSFPNKSNRQLQVQFSANTSFGVINNSEIFINA